MDYNLKVEVALVVVVVSFTHTKVLMLKDEKLPSAIISNESCLESIKKLLKRHLKVDSNWVVLVQAPIVDKVLTNNSLIIPYGCMIPEEISISDEVYWRDLMDLIGHNSIEDSQAQAIKNVVLKL